MTDTELTLTPAYGRDYSSKKDVQTDWDADKDFQIATPEVKGRYINKADAERYNVPSVSIRYQKLTKVMTIKTN